MGLPREGMKHVAEWVELRQRMKEHVEESNQRLFQGTYQFEGMSEYSHDVPSLLGMEQSTK